jgi:hypothetical protein
MTFDAARSSVKNRGEPPESFLTEIVEWGRAAPDEIFAPNSNSKDIYSLTLNPMFGYTKDLSRRRAEMLEVMRVHAGFESSWNWNEGVDTTNRTSITHPEGQETGIFQVSFDSTYIGDMKQFADDNGIGTVDTFIPAMKSNHPLALTYYAKLVRINIRWAGPLIRHEVDPWLSKSAVDEFQALLI